ncbi:MAG: glycosyltransferase [Clostridiales bacterium]|nr:glycosyltransferase [Clostridiales bacterium]
MTPFFSLILPVYNVEAYLERCIRSIVDQGFADVEIILVDDGATDRSPEICDQWAERHEQIRVIHKPNGGLSSARNAGLEQARGDYVWFVDSDDWIEPGALETLHQACRDGEADVVKFEHFRVTGEKTAVRGIVAAGRYEAQEQLAALRRQAFCSAGKYVLSVWSHVYCRAFLHEHGLAFVSERDIGSEDYLFNLTALMYAQSVQVLAQPLYCYELRDGSLTQQYKPDLPLRYTRLYQLMKQAYQDAGQWEQHRGLICRFYVWHLMAGTCFHHEYSVVTDTHPLADGRKNVRAILGMKEVQKAVRLSDQAGLRWPKRIQLLAMRMKAEGLFCWLYTRKTGR